MGDCVTDPLVVPDYSNHLAEPSPIRTKPALRPLVLVGLFILCLIPRALIATKCSSVCPDATLYINIAKKIDNGQWDTKAISPRYVAYSSVIAMMHRVGFDWETGARCWGIVISSLAVLPLFGWVRRQFDDRVALGACFLYIVHPRLIEWAPSIIRDPTFWFFFVLSIYLAWRAISEVRLSFFLFAGIAVTISALIRTEGFLLVIPFVLWSIYRWWFLQENRWRLAIGASVVFFVFPAILIASSFFVLKGSSSEIFQRLYATTAIKGWQQSVESNLDLLLASETTTPAQTSAPIASDEIHHKSIGQTNWHYAKSLSSGGTIIFWFLLLGGIVCWQGAWARGDNLPLFFVALIVFIGIWIDLRLLPMSSNRYPLTIVLATLPFAALALLGISERLRETAVRHNFSNRRQLISMALPLLFIVAVNFSELSADRYEMWKVRADLGHWMRTELGRPPMIAGNGGVVKVSSYYSGGNYSTYSFKKRPASIVKMARKPDIDFLLLSRRDFRSFDPKDLLVELDRLGFEEVDSKRLPVGADEVIVFEKKFAGIKQSQRAATPRM